MPKTLFDYLPLELASHSLSFNSVKDHGIAARASKDFKESADDFAYWNNMLDEKSQSDVPGQAKRTFLENPDSRLPKYLTVDYIGKEHVVNQIIAGNYNDPVSRIIRGEVTAEEAEILEEIAQQLLAGGLNYNGMRALESGAVRGFIASGQLPIEQAIDLSLLGRLALESGAVRGFIASGQLPIEQAINLSLLGRTALESGAVRGFIASGQLPIEQAIDLSFLGRLALENGDLSIIDNPENQQDEPDGNDSNMRCSVM